MCGLGKAGPTGMSCISLSSAAESDSLLSGQKLLQHPIEGDPFVTEYTNNSHFVFLHDPDSRCLDEAVEHYDAHNCQYHQQNSGTQTHTYPLWH